MKPLHVSTRIWFVLLAFVPLVNARANGQIALFYDGSMPPLRFAAEEIRRSCSAQGSVVVEGKVSELQGSAASTVLILAADAEQRRRVQGAFRMHAMKDTQFQSYGLRTTAKGSQTVVAVLGADPVGAMYGGLDVAEAIRLGRLKQLIDADHVPYIARRGIKFNIPLDARTPSYSDNSDAAQQNIPEMWSMDFWREFLQEMARDRYNVLTLWNLHPFPSLVKVPEFPDVALDGVKRSTIAMDETFSHSGSDMVRPEMLQQLETIKQLSIDEKILFWCDVMQAAHDLGIEVYFFTWNLFVFGAEGKYGITRSQTNPTTIDYFRASVRQTVLTYPLLAGIGVTAGEQMENRQDEFSKEKWLWKTYGEGIRDALQLQPDRRFRLIHRYHQTAQGEILDAWKEYPSVLDLSFKYAIAHMYSSPSPPFIRDALPNIPPHLRTWLTVRNDDIYSFRWGDPEFARAFIRNMPGPDKAAGFYMGPDGTVWGRECIGTEPTKPRQLVIKKQWYSFTLWGRLAYDPDLPDSLFRRMLAVRFPETDGVTLFRAWSSASKIFPQITRFFWGDIDLRWFPEACLSHPKYRGFYTVRHFIEGSTMPESGILNILAFRKQILGRTPAKGITPLQVAETLHNDAATALTLVSKLRPVRDAELRQTLTDLEAMARLGNYYSEKILGAVELAFFDKTGNPEQKASALRHLEKALEHWKTYAGAYHSQYVARQLFNRVGFVDRNQLTTSVQQDVEIARTWRPGTIQESGSKNRDADRPFVK